MEILNEQYFEISKGLPKTLCSLAFYNECASDAVMRTNQMWRFCAMAGLEDRTLAGLIHIYRDAMIANHNVFGPHNKKKHGKFSKDYIAQKKQKSEKLDALCYYAALQVLQMPINLQKIEKVLLLERLFPASNTARLLLIDTCIENGIKQNDFVKMGFNQSTIHTIFTGTSKSPNNRIWHDFISTYQKIGLPPPQMPHSAQAPNSLLDI